MHNDWIIKEDVNKLTFQEDVLVLDKFIPETICKDIQDYAFNKAEWTYTNTRNSLRYKKPKKIPRKEEKAKTAIKLRKLTKSIKKMTVRG